MISISNSHAKKSLFAYNIQFELVLLVFLCLLHCKKEVNTSSLTPLEKLKQGNERFISGKPMHPDANWQRIRELNKGQNPFATILSCSDSRVPPELLFDQGFGDIFSVRTAGNVLGEFELGSIEYAVEHLHVKLILVLGHTDCGAIKAFIETRGRYPHTDHLKSIVDYINEEEEEKALIKNHDLTMEHAIKANVEHAVHILKKSKPILFDLYTKKEIQILGAIYDLETGRVVFLKE
jgi:carbonic anhydrase